MSEAVLLLGMVLEVVAGVPDTKQPAISSAATRLSENTFIAQGYQC